MLVINKDGTGRPHVLYEALGQWHGGQTEGDPSWFLLMNKGGGLAWKGKSQGKKVDQDAGIDLDKFLKAISKDSGWKGNGIVEIVKLQDKRRLGIATLGALKQHPRIAAFRQFIEGWCLSYFAPDAARGLPLAGPQPHLSVHGDNLGNVVQFMEREHGDRFARILRRIAERIPASTGSTRCAAPTTACCCASPTRGSTIPSTPSKCPTAR